jgi:tetratricopeptide (TPR) repeat protein
MILKKIFLSIFLCFGIVSAIFAGKFDALYRTGLRKLNERDYKEALKQFKEAYDNAELSREEIKIMFAIANVYSRQKKYKDAESWVKRIFDIPDLKAADKEKAYRILINYSIKQEHYNDALDYAEEAFNNIEGDNKKFFIIEKAKVLEIQKDYSKAVKVLKPYVDKCTPKSKLCRDIYQKYVVILFKQKEFAKILKLLDKLEIKKWDDDSRRIVSYYGGLCAWEQGDYKRAVHWFETMPDAGPSWMIYSKNSQLGNCWLKLNDYSKAYKCFEIIYKNSTLRNYYRANGLLLMAETLWLQKKYKEAAALCEEVKKYPETSKNQVKRAERLLEKINSLKK